VEFIGRKDELETLHKFAGSKEPAIAVIYGRRRIGKSLLIKQALRGSDVLFFDALEERPRREQIRHFMFQLHQQLEALDRIRIPTLVSLPDTWKEAFLRLFDAVKDKPCAIVFDEFQWMANYRHELVADLKYVWDGFFATLKGQKLILCGSIASFMIHKVIKSSAFYGRIDVQMQLAGFKLKETGEMLAGRGVDEIIQAQMLTGGVPKYLRLLNKYSSVQLAMEDLAFTPNGYLTSEYERIFTSHFGKNPNFEKIGRTLAAHPLGLFREELAGSAKLAAGGQLSTQLRDLESAGFISTTTPFDKGENSRQIRYFLSDAYLRFYFSFIRPNIKKIRSSHSKNLFAAITQTGAYHAWIGRSFEYLCLQHADLISQQLGFSGIDFTIGPYFAPTKGTEAGVQVDLVFDRADGVLTVCEMKYSRRPVGTDVIPEMERKVQSLQRASNRKTIQRVLITRDKPTQSLLETGYFYRIIDASVAFIAI
jgi:uncharacterized protein